MDVGRPSQASDTGDQGFGKPPGCVPMLHLRGGEGPLAIAILSDIRPRGVHAERALRFGLGVGRQSGSRSRQKVADCFETIQKKPVNKKTDSSRSGRAMAMALSLLCGIAGASGLGSKQAWYRPNQTAFYSKVASLERGDLYEGRSRSAGGGRLKGAYACAIPHFLRHTAA